MRREMLIGKRSSKPVLIYIVFAIVLLSLILTLAWSRYQRTAAPTAAPLHENK
jgi:hypothetical protein